MAKTTWTYCTKNDIILRIPNIDQFLQFSDTTISQYALLKELCTFAEAELHEYVSECYAVPLTCKRNNYKVKEYCLVLIEYRLYQRLMLEKLPLRVHKNYEKTIKELTEIKEGKRIINGAKRLSRKSVLTTFTGIKSSFEDMS